MQHTPITPSADAIRPPNGPYSHALAVRPDLRWVYISGQMGVAPDGSIPPDVETQTEIVWGNCVHLLEEAGMTMDDVVRVSHYIVGRENLDGYNKARARFFGDARPASTLLIVAGLALPGLLVETDMVAARPA